MADQVMELVSEPVEKTYNLKCLRLRNANVFGIGNSGLRLFVSGSETSDSVC